MMREEPDFDKRPAPEYFDPGRYVFRPPPAPFFNRRSHPQRALELLTLPISPVPRSIAWRLEDALQQWPAVDSDDWQKALAAGLAEVTDEKRRQTLKSRLDVLLKPAVTGNIYPAAELKRRNDVLQGWIRGYLDNADEKNRSAWEAALVQCLNLQLLAGLTKLDGFTRPQLQRLLEESVRDVPMIESYPAQAGLCCVPTPGSINGAVDHIIWWNFSRSAAETIEPLPFSPAERNVLAEKGVRLPKPAETAAAANARWHRPLQYASKTLLLVCPRNAEDGEDQHPHPLWDEIVANAGSTRLLQPLVVDRPKFLKAPKLIRHELLAIPVPRWQWKLPAGLKISPREVESPTGAASLVGCPFNWVLKYVAGIREGSLAMLSDSETLLGKLAHEILARVLAEKPATPAKAEKRALELFDSEGPRMAAVLFMAGAETLKASSRLATGRSAFQLVDQLRQAKLAVIGVEQSYDGLAFGTKMSGRLDLLVGTPEVIVDLKWGGERYRRDELANGASSQLAAYSHLRKTDGHVPPVAFFILQSQRLLTTQPDLFPAAIVIDGPPPEETFTGFEAAYRERMKELADGVVAAPGELDEKGKLTPEKGVLQEGKLQLTPPCKFCKFGLLCGQELNV